MAKEIITAQEVVKSLHIPYHTLNYYTAIGLLLPVKKVGNKRLYDKRAIKERLHRISKLTKEGYPLHLIRKKLLGV